MKPLRVLLPTLGSAGDVHPFIALALALRARGHEPIILTNPFFEDLITQQGFRFLPIGNIDTARTAIANPDVWDLRKGFGILASLIVPSIEQVFAAIERHSDDSTVVAYSTLAFGARVAQEKLGVPSASVHLQPSVIRTFGDQGMFGNVRLSASHPRWFKKMVFRLADSLIIDRHVKAPLNRFRATLGLASVDRVMFRWVHSPQCVIGFFPEWFAPPQPDWPPNTHAVGFPLWDAGDEEIPQGAEDFLNGGEPPVIFTPGSAGATMQQFFDESVRAASSLRLRAMLVTNYPEQVPAVLPDGIQVFGYLPFSKILPRASLLVYHGGIGTLAQAVKAGVRQLVVPHGYDQFDSGWRLERLGLGRTISMSRYRANRVADAIADLLAADGNGGRRGAYSARLDSAAALTRACELIESLRQ